MLYLIGLGWLALGALVGLAFGAVAEKMGKDDVLVEGDQG